MKYQCPLCGSVLSKHDFHKVLRIREQEVRVQKGNVEKAKREIAAAKAAAADAKKREMQVRFKAKDQVKEARAQEALAQHRRSQRITQGLTARMKRLQDRIKMLESNRTPQEVGLADEPALVSKLKREFTDDRIEHAGKGGDVLNFARFNDEEVGCS